MLDLNNKRVIISRTDSIGDVMLTLPMCAWIKKYYKNVHITFLGKAYTKAIVNSYKACDDFVDWGEIESMSSLEQKIPFRKIKADIIIHVFPKKEIARLAKAVKIPIRVGTSHRIFHLTTCNNRLDFTRKRSELHEAQLNFNLLKPFGLKDIPSLDELIEFTSEFSAPNVESSEFLVQNKGAVILHPKSQGSAVEWPIEKYIELAQRLSKRGIKVVFTGTKSEGDLFRDKIPVDKNIVDGTGKVTLEELILFISNAQTLVACSTGPLHIAGFSGIQTIGLFSPKRPIHPGRWKALGPRVTILEYDENCNNCSKRLNCNCIADIEVESIDKLIIKEN